MIGGYEGLMNRTHTHERRLNVVAAVTDGARAMPRIWRGAWAALAQVSVLALAPVFMTLTGTLAIVHAVWLALAVWVAWGALSRVGTARSNVTAWAEGLGPGGLQFGKVELRLMGAMLLNLIFIAMILCVLVLAALVVAGMAELDVAAIQARDWGAAGSPWRLGLVCVVAALTVWVPLIFVIRLGLFSQATVGRGHAVSLNTLGIAQGSFWPLALLFGPIAMAVLGLVALQVAGGMAGRIVGMLGLIWVVAPFAAGVLGAAYRQLEYWTPQGGAR